MSNRIAVAVLAAGFVLAGCSGSGSDEIGPTDPTSGNGDPGGSSGVGEFHPSFPAACGVLPFPTDLYFAGSTDGTLNSAGDAFPTERRDAERARRLLDGGELDRALLGAHQRGNDLARDRDLSRGRRRQRDESDGRVPSRARRTGSTTACGLRRRPTPAARRSRSFPSSRSRPRPAPPTWDIS